MKKNPSRSLSRRFAAKLLTLLGFSSSFVFMACYGPPPTDYRFEVFPGDLVLDADAGSEAEITIATDGQWEATAVPSFVSLSDSSGVGTTVVTVRTVGDNRDSANNDSVIVVESDRGRVKVPVSQIGK
jgi:hypothetical protein